MSDPAPAPAPAPQPCTICKDPTPLVPKPGTLYQIGARLRAWVYDCPKCLAVRTVPALVALLLAGCAHSRSTTEHVTTSTAVEQEATAASSTHERVEEGPSETIRMEGVWTVGEATEGALLPATLAPGGSARPTSAKDPGTTALPGNAGATPAPRPPGALTFTGSIEVTRRGPRVEERDTSATSTERAAGKAEQRKDAQEQTATTVGPPWWVWPVTALIALVLLGAALAVRRALRKTGLAP